jgi:hypothetical protein
MSNKVIERLTLERYLRKEMTYQQAVIHYNPLWIKSKASKYLYENYNQIMSLEDFLDCLYEDFKHKVNKQTVI